MSFFKQCLVGIICTLLLAATVSAAAPGPMEKINATVDEVLSILKNKEIDKSARRGQLRCAIFSRFNFDEMAQRILALNWKKATDQQRSEFVTIFSELLERNYVGHIESYTDEKVEFIKERIIGNRAAVDSVIYTNTVEIPISYRLVQVEDDWKVYDVVIENVSFINNYRSSYGEIVKDEGFDGLLTRMSEKLEELKQSNGNPS
ncbi:MAG: ABC transporter substrate-binding protein [Desulfuromonadaceae bacterium]